VKITKIAVFKFLGLTEFTSGRLGKFNRIEGGNGVGKTSLLKAIREGFKSSGVDPALINIQGGPAEIMIELDDGALKIGRRITETANDFKVVADGQPVTRAVEYLRRLLGPTAFNFDPTEFYLGSAKERRELLLKAITFKLHREKLEEMVKAKTKKSFGDYGLVLDSIDFEGHGLVALKKVSQLVFDRRAEVNLDVTRLDKAIQQDKADFPKTEDLSEFEGFDPTAAAAQIAKAHSEHTQHESDLYRLARLRGEAAYVFNEIEETEKRLTELRKKFDAISNEGKALREKVDSFRPIDVLTLELTLKKYNENQKLVLKKEEIAKREAELGWVRGKHRELDDLHKYLVNDISKEVLSQVNLPIQGLTFEDDTVLLDGVAIEKLSTSEQMRFAVRLAKALAGNLKVICVDRFESLDLASRKAFEAEANGDDYEYFLSAVTDGPLTVSSESVTMEPETKKAPERPTAKTAVGF